MANTGIEYWPILGYGICVSEKIINHEKAFELMSKHDYKDLAETPKELLLEDILQFLCEISPIPLYWSTVNSCDNTAYLYVPAVLPWDDYPKITKEKADEILTKLASNVLVKDCKIKPCEIEDVGPSY